MYKRVLLKLSGEALSGTGDRRSINTEALTYIAGEIRRALKKDLQLAIVIGGGNIWRGARDGKSMIGRVTAAWACLPPL